jgi:hypothetical protein
MCCGFEDDAFCHGRNDIALHLLLFLFFISQAHRVECDKSLHLHHHARQCACVIFRICFVGLLHAFLSRLGHGQFQHMLWSRLFLYRCFRHNQRFYQLWTFDPASRLCHICRAVSRHLAVILVTLTSPHPFEQSLPNDCIHCFDAHGQQVSL